MTGETSLQSNEAQPGQPSVQPQAPSVAAEAPQPGATPNKEPEVPTERSYTQSEYSLLQSSLRKEVQGHKDTNKGLTARVTELEGLNALLQEEVDNPYTEEGEKEAAQKVRDARKALIAREAQAKVREDTLGEKEIALKETEGKSTRETLAAGLSTKLGISVEALLNSGTELDMLQTILNAETQPQAAPEKLPPPVGVGGVPSGELTDEQRLKERYPSMHK